MLLFVKGRQWRQFLPQETQMIYSCKNNCLFISHFHSFDFLWLWTKRLPFSFPVLRSRRNTCPCCGLVSDSVSIVSSSSFLVPSSDSPEGTEGQWTRISVCECVPMCMRAYMRVPYTEPGHHSCSTFSLHKVLFLGRSPLSLLNPGWLFWFFFYYTCIHLSFIRRVKRVCCFAPFCLHRVWQISSELHSFRVLFDIESEGCR